MAQSNRRPVSVAFDSPSALHELEALDSPALDALDFGVVRMDRSGIVTAYNRAEAELSGLRTARVLGRNFFEHVAPCTRNALIAQRYLHAPELDAIVPYVFAFALRPTRVRLRLLKSERASSMYLLVERAP